MCEDGKEGMSLILEEPHSWKKNRGYNDFFIFILFNKIAGKFLV